MFWLGSYAYWADKFSNTCVSAADPHLLLDDGLVCGGGFTCPDGYECMHVEGFVLNHGVTGYYDIWHAMLQVSTLLTQTFVVIGWGDIAVRKMQSVDVRRRSATKSCPSGGVICTRNGRGGRRDHRQAKQPVVMTKSLAP